MQRDYALGTNNQSLATAYQVSVLKGFPASNDSATTPFPFLMGSNDTMDIPEQRALSEIIIVGMILMALVLVTILGNLLVCVVILSNRRLQNPTNYFILSLSLSDLSLGILVLPFSTINSILSSWPLGAIFCNIYNSFDVMLCTVSILNLFAISLDRYYAVTYPLRYVQRVNSRRVFWVCMGIWIFSFVMAFVPIHLGLNTPQGVVQNFKHPKQCVFLLNQIYVLLVSIGTYFIPLIIMCTVYTKVFYIAKKQVKNINKMTQIGNHLHNGTSSPKRDQRMASDTKATFTLASVVTAFAICWVPYFIVFTIKPFLPNPISPHLDLFVLWLGYVNSLLNPFLYAFHNTEFRYAFMMVLCKKRAEKYKDRYSDASYV